MLSMSFAVYTAHVKDGYVDFYYRDEDDDHPLTEWGCRIALIGATIGFVCCLAVLWVIVGIEAVLITLPTWFIGYLHAPQLDMNLVGATLGYPAGISLSIIGGYYVQAGSLSMDALAFAFVFLVVISGIKIIDDAIDYEYDRSISKQTVAVVLGRRRARRTAYGLLIFGLIAVCGFALATVFPPGTVLATIPFAVVVYLARQAGPEFATMLLIRGSYLFLAVLIGQFGFVRLDRIHQCFPLLAIE